MATLGAADKEHDGNFLENPLGGRVAVQEWCGLHVTNTAKHTSMESILKFAREAVVIDDDTVVRAKAAGTASVALPFVPAKLF